MCACSPDFLHCHIPKHFLTHYYFLEHLAHHFTYQNKNEVWTFSTVKCVQLLGRVESQWFHGTAARKNSLLWPRHIIRGYVGWRERRCRSRGRDRVESQASMLYHWQHLLGLHLPQSQSGSDRPIRAQTGKTQAPHTRIKAGMAQEWGQCAHSSLWLTSTNTFIFLKQNPDYCLKDGGKFWSRN